MNYDDSVLEKDTVIDGGTAEYKGSAPTKPGTTQYTYAFSGWDKDLVNVHSSFSAKAQFEKATNSYAITFKNYDGTVLQTGDVKYGDTPSYNGLTPTKPTDSDYSYDFSGWSPTIVSVTKSATYTAQYQSVALVKDFEITGDKTENRLSATIDETSEIESSLKNASGDSVKFKNFMTTKPLGKWNALSVGGYFYNVTALNSLASIEMTFVGSLTIDYGWTGDQFPIKGQAINSGTPYQFDGTKPTYLRVNATGSEATQIESINIKYSSITSEDKYYCTPGIEFTLSASGDSYSVSKYTGSIEAETIDIPSMHDGLPVKAIANGVFASRYIAHPAGAYFAPLKMKAVNMPKSIISIGDNAFEYCSSLETIVFPSGLVSIGSSCFYKAKIQNVFIPKALAKIGDRAFRGCLYKTIEVEAGNPTYSVIGNCLIKTNDKALVCGTNEAIIPTDGSVTSIYGYAFEGASPKKGGFIISSAITKIYAYAFNKSTAAVHCEAASKPADWSDIWDKTDNFSSASTETTLTITWGSLGPTFSGPLSGYVNLEGNVIITGYDGSSSDVVVPESIDGKKVVDFGDVFTKNVTITSLTINCDVTSLSSGCFSGCTALTSVTLPDGLLKIPSKAFMGCKKLTSVNIPEHVTEIGEYAFNGCTSLEEMLLPISVLQISQYAFSGCTSLSSIALPKALTSIGQHAFEGCSKIASLSFPATLETIDGYAFSECSSLESVVLKGVLETIGSYAFNECVGMKTLEIGGGDVRILGYAFFDCKKLASVTLADGLAFIGNYAFCKCGFSSIKLPDSLKAVGSGAFGECASLTSVVVPESVTSIGTYAFTACVSLKEITLPSALSGVLPEGTFRGCTSLASFTVPNGITEIGYGTFEGCSKLSSVTLSENLTKIGRRAFINCLALPFIMIPDGVTEIGAFAFQGCSSLKYVSLPATLTSINSSTTTFGDLSTGFIVCVRGASISSQVLNYLGKATVLFNAVSPVSEGDFRGFLNLDGEVTLYSYKGSSSAVTIPEEIDGLSVVSLEKTFYKNTTIKKVTIADNVITIGAEAFYGCTNLSTLILGAGVVTIDSTAFNGCTSLAQAEVIYYKGTPTQWKSVGYTAFAPTVAYYQENEPTKNPDDDGNYYWHFDAEGNPALWSY